MECLIEESAKKKPSGRHVSFDYVPSEIDFQQNVVLQEIVISRVLRFSRFKESLVKLGKLEWSFAVIIVIDWTTIFWGTASVDHLKKEERVQDSEGIKLRLSTGDQKVTENKPKRNKSRRKSVDISVIPVPRVVFSKDGSSGPIHPL